MSMVQRSYRGGVGQPYEASRRELLERNKGYSAQKCENKPSSGRIAGAGFRSKQSAKDVQLKI